MLNLRRPLTVVLAVAIVLAGLVGAGASADEGRGVSPVKGGAPQQPEVPDVAKGLIVKTTTSVPSDGLLAATQDVLQDEADGEAAVTDGGRLLPRVSTVDFDEIVPGEVAAQVADEIAERDDVVWVTPNRLRRAQAAPPVSTDDELFTRQKNLWNTDGSLPYGGYSIKAPSLWRATKGSSATVVAVIDTGILPGHPDLAGKVVDGYDMISDLDTANDEDGRDADPTDPGDWNDDSECEDSGARRSSWHGTFVAGQIGAVTDNGPGAGSGIAAVAPRVKLQAVRALGTCGGYDSDIMDAMTWASGGVVPVDPGDRAGAKIPVNPTPAPIVNLSLAGPPVSATDRNDDCKAYNEVAKAGKERGSIFVAAAGNDGANANRVTPASCSELISVGATSVKGFSAIYANVGSTVDLSAPGGDSTLEGSSDRIWSLTDRGTTVQEAYAVGTAEGTSMAAPQVAGAAALLHDLGFVTPKELTAALYAAVTPFRARSGAYAHKEVYLDEFFDLNCTAPGREWCGRGLLDLTRVEAPLAAPVISGEPVVGEPLTASLGGWVRKPANPTYVWRVGGETRETSSSTYWPTVDDIGKPITVTVVPSTSAFRKLVNVSAAVTIPSGPKVTLERPATPPTYGAAFSLVARVDGARGGQIELRTDAGTVRATGTVGDDGVAMIQVPSSAARKLKPGNTLLRAAYLGNGTTAAGSSPRRNITIRRLPAKVSTSLGTRVRTTSRATLRVEVRESPNLFAHPTGELRVYDGSRRLRITRLYSTSGGKKTIRLPRLTKGTHRIKVYFRDSDYITSTYSTVRTIKAS